ncbi:52 kDa repressor of the inhibitor of the protein kinase-like isoform X2 [Anoplophora glabripennis]|uniref:52 kDa repressor of the inhibitor of the protein kinase-like isoform X2 n=1 Tax=Anoplophora glabripennis TaxID=217634 RepID=UPI000874DFA0|nr:52 kDa repressor of the inhibitor of the protein kinase-like isoform X2 [Anoplophora glabripennis]
MNCGVERKYGVSCAAKNCNSRQSNTQLSFFRFPKDIDRAKIWALACNREDLFDRLNSLNQSHRLCSIHFEKKMYMNKECKRLIHNAVPTLFACLEGGSKFVDHTYSRHPLVTVRIENKENEA